MNDLTGRPASPRCPDRPGRCDRLHARLVAAAAGRRHPRRRLPHRRHARSARCCWPRPSGPGAGRVRREDHDAVLRQLAERVSPRILRAPARLDDAARELDEYFAAAGGPVRPAAGPAARVRVPAAGADPPAGDRLRPDRELRRGRGARAIRGRCARSARRARPTRCRWWCPATGWSLRRQPGRYAGGPEAKRALLALERREPATIRTVAGSDP